MQFEWHEKKAAINLRKHGVSFDEATQVFDDPRRIIVFDSMSFDYGEERFAVVGLSNVRLLSVSYTERGGSIRLISARKASRQEHDDYKSQNPQI